MSARPRVPCLMYHEVADDPRSSGFQRRAASRYRHTPRAFAGHLVRLAEARIEPAVVVDLDLAEPGATVLLTFDDGGKSAIEVAAALGARGWRAHFFVVTGQLGSPTFLTAASLRALRGAGHLIGSHSHTHPDIFRQLSRARMLEEWRVSRSVLEDLIGEPCLAASVPGGDISDAVLETACESGFRYLFTSEPEPVPRRLADTWIIGRVCVTAGTTPNGVARYATGRGWRAARLVRGIKELARNGLGPLYRIYVDHATRPLPPEPARADRAGTQ